VLLLRAFASLVSVADKMLDFQETETRPRFFVSFSSMEKEIEQAELN
jgi:hypothetical protein